MKNVKRYIEVNEAGEIELDSSTSQDTNLLRDNGVTLDIRNDKIELLSNNSIATYRVVKKGFKFLLELEMIERAYR